MKWFFRFAIFWMHIRWTWCDLQWACHDSQNKNPNSMWILRQWGTKTQWRGGKAGGPPCCLPVCATRICSFFGRMLAIARVCVCKSVGRVCECERQSPCTLFSLPSQPSASALSLHLQSCCARSKRTEVCIVFLKGRGGGVGVVRMMTRWKGPGEEETQECPFPLSPFSFSLSLALASSLSLCDVVCVRVCCVCEREREWNRSAMLQQTGLWTCTGGSSPFQIEVCHWIVITRISTIPAPRGEICDWVKDGMLKAVETDSRGSVFSHQITHYVNVSTLKDKDVWE